VVVSTELRATPAAEPAAEGDDVEALGDEELGVPAAAALEVELVAEAPQALSAITAAPHTAALPTLLLTVRRTGAPVRVVVVVTGTPRISSCPSPGHHGDPGRRSWTARDRFMRAGGEPL
jgi:hypothetical protein